MGLKDIRKNPIALTDAYNLSHQRLKCNTDWETSHIYNRASGMILYGLNETVLSILQIQVTIEMIDEAEEAAKRMGLIFPRKLWEDVVNKCNGYVPIKVESLPEGTWSPKGTPFAQVSNTVEGFGELVTWFEGVFIMAYFPSACATEAFFMKRYLVEMQKEFEYDDSFLLKFHSFGFRGHRSLEDAYWAGTSWNLFLHGTDDFHTALHTATAKISSISALAHKVTQQFDDEQECFLHAIRETAACGEKIIALVIDTYDAERVINQYLVTIAAYARKLGTHIVLRPDSGDVLQQAIEIYRICKSFRIKNVSVIIGEGISFEVAKKYDAHLRANGVPINFVFYGIGGGFYRHIERDTLGWAMKTGFSNGKPRMKFSMATIKRSIPGKINIIKIGKSLTVLNSDEDNAISFVSQYYTIYNHTTTIPEVEVANWTKTQARALSQSTDQEVIYVSEKISEMVEEFRKTYKG
jgi:nicotinamide phosphoribosyltransferase